MIRTLIALEWRLLARSKAALSLLVLVVILSAAAALIGETDRARRTEIQTRFLTSAVEQEASFREALLQAERGEDISPYLARPMLITNAAALPDGILGDFSIGAADRFPDRVNVRLWETSASLFGNYQFENPTTLSFGRLDLTMVVVVILPLLMIAMSFDALGTDRQSGRLSSLLAAGASERKLLWTRLTFRTLALWLPFIGVTLIALVAHAAPSDFAARSVHYLAWVAGALAYGLFWLFAISAVLARTPTAGQAAARLTGLWTLLVLIIPAVSAALIQAAYPAPSRLAYLTEIRAATALADEGAQAWLEGYALANPDLQIERDDSAAPFRSGYQRTAMVEAQTAPLVAAFNALEADRRRTRAWLDLLSPSALAESYLTAMAGGHADRYRDFQRRARDHLALSRETLGPAIMEGRRISVDDYDGLPRLREELTDHSIRTGSLQPLGLLTGFILIAFAFAAFSRKYKA